MSSCNKYYRVTVSMLRKIFQKLKVLRVNLKGGCNEKRAKTEERVVEISILDGRKSTKKDE